MNKTVYMVLYTGNLLNLDMWNMDTVFLEKQKNKSSINSTHNLSIMASEKFTKKLANINLISYQNTSPIN